MNFEFRNHVIAALPAEGQEFLRERLITRPMAQGEIIYPANSEMKHIVFPHDGVISLMAEMDNGRSVEKASVGLEGIIGFTLLLGGTATNSKCLVQIPGYASWLSAYDFRTLMEFPGVTQAMLLYANALIVRTMHSNACGLIHSAEQRIARWILQADDRVQAKEMQLTQKALAELLGLRRATVNDVCSMMARENIIQYSRGTLSVIDHDALMEKSCECYVRIKGGFDLLA